MAVLVAGGAGYIGPPVVRLRQKNLTARGSQEKRTSRVARRANNVPTIS